MQCQIADATEEKAAAARKLNIAIGESSTLNVQNLRAIQQLRRGHSRVQAYLLSGEPIGWAIRDQAEENRFTFSLRLTADIILNVRGHWCRAATQAEKAKTGTDFTILPDFRPSAIVFANGSIAGPYDDLACGPGPITILQSSEDDDGWEDTEAEENYTARTQRSARQTASFL